MALIVNKGTMMNQYIHVLTNEKRIIIGSSTESQPCCTKEATDLMNFLAFVEFLFLSIAVKNFVFRKTFVLAEAGSQYFE